MRYVVSVSYQDCGKDEESVREKARKLFGRRASITVRKAEASILSPLTVFQRCKQIRESRKEVFVAIALDTQNNVIKSEVISVGILNASLVHPREIFNFAIQNLASHLIIAHNHPSGSVEPSQEDIVVTKRLREVGMLVGIQVIDHVIVTQDRYTSFKEQGLI